MSSTKNSVNEPSLYIDNMKQFLTQKNEKLSADALKMNNSAVELQNQIDGVVSSCSDLEKVKKEMAEEVSEYLLKINELQKKNFVDEDKIANLNKEITDLKESIDNVELEKNNRLSMVSQLQEQFDNKEKEWSNQKTMLLQELEQIDNSLKTYISSTETNISSTTRMIEAANEKLLTRMPFGETRSMFYGSDTDPLTNFENIITKYGINTDNNNLFGDGNVAGACIFIDPDTSTSIPEKDLNIEDSSDESDSEESQ